MALIFIFSVTIFANESTSDNSTVYAVPPGGGRVYPGTNVSVIPGDVLVTNDTRSMGLHGHAAIVGDWDGVTVSIEGSDYNPGLTSLDDWFKKRPNTKGMRWTSASSQAINAGFWAKSYVSTHPNATFSLVNSLGDQDKVYCSKIPWMAFYYGSNIAIDGHSYIANMVYSPYAWLSASKMSAVATIGAT
ncbi:hypothetical protein [Paenibacillus chitinolyticus]|uniref:hypothetical protein n=1 Tax=Paenibacillus chitinolyticus TaxID=79263 RepID=UPI00363F8856